jgi:hypothetical protein
VSKNDQPKTAAALKSRYGTTSLATSGTPVIDLADTTDFVIVITKPLTTTN